MRTRKKAMSNSKQMSIAILNMMGDSSFNTYNFGLAEGLGQQGVEIDLYTCGEDSIFDELPSPQFHKRFNVLGSFLFRGNVRVRETAANSLGNTTGALETARVQSWRRQRWMSVRRYLLTHELLWHLRRSGHTLLWTQWPDMDPYLQNFWSWARRYGFRIVHTVHNVLPHEVRPGDRERAKKIYETADLLFLHSEQAKESLFAEFPLLDSRKVALHPIGLYTMVERVPRERSTVRRRLMIPEGQPMLLACGLIRPYKNIDAILVALSAPEFSHTILTIAGRESGFSDSDPNDPLRRTRGIVEELGISDRVRLIPRFLPVREMAALFEAADALLIPYKEGYGSALLLMGMTFEKHVFTTPVGGALEYLEHYPNHTLVEGAEPDDLRSALRGMLLKIYPNAETPKADLSRFHWMSIGKQIKRAFDTAFS